MSEYQKEKFVGIFLIIIVLTLVGVSYAFFNYTLTYIVTTVSLLTTSNCKTT